ncbi:hypothetical protein R6Q57_011873 [Mikania cordata]
MEEVLLDSTTQNQSGGMEVEPMPTLLGTGALGAGAPKPPQNLAAMASMAHSLEPNTDAIMNSKPSSGSPSYADKCKQESGKDPPIRRFDRLWYEDDTHSGDESRSREGDYSRFRRRQ